MVLCFYISNNYMIGCTHKKLFHTMIYLPASSNQMKFLPHVGVQITSAVKKQILLDIYNSLEKQYRQCDDLDQLFGYFKQCGQSQGCILLRQRIGRKHHVQKSHRQYHYYERQISPKFTPVARLLFYIFTNKSTIRNSLLKGWTFVLHNTGDGQCQDTVRCVNISHLRLGNHAMNMEDKKLAKSN